MTVTWVYFYYISLLILYQLIALYIVLSRQ